jgi:hypothetical protein
VPPSEVPARPVAREKHAWGADVLASEFSVRRTPLARVLGWRRSQSRTARSREKPPWEERVPPSEVPARPVARWRDTRVPPSEVRARPVTRSRDKLPTPTRLGEGVDETRFIALSLDERKQGDEDHPKERSL